MSVLGPTEDAEQFLRNLDEKKLVDLCTDILTLEGHTEIKITDGPGDGQRDIHSKNSKRENFLTQSKFHGNPSSSVSAKELGEVVLGMVKFGYKKGRFITNARLSPQAKRECLNDYPGYSVDFIDGLEFIKRVLGNLILKALWYDGQSLDRISFSLVVPIIARDLRIDRPIKIASDDKDTQIQDIIKSGRTEAQVKLQLSSITTSSFEQYRPPRIRTISESGLTTTRSTEAIISGFVHLEDLKDLLFLVGNHVIDKVYTPIDTEKELVAVQLGRPYLAPLSGQYPGARIQVEDYEPFTLVRHVDSIEHELDWLCPTSESNWFLPERFSTSASDWVRWYNPRIDICLDLTIVSPPSSFSIGIIAEQYDYFLKWWRQSRFILVPKSQQLSWTDLGVPEPTVIYDWDEKTRLCVWIHPNLNVGIRPSLVEPDEIPGDDQEDYSSLFLADPNIVKNEFNRIQEKLDVIGGIGVHSDKARHMIALIDHDPFPTTETVSYRSVDLLRDPEIIPSPIDPTSRAIEFTVCWLISDLTQASDKAELEKYTQEAIERGFLPFAFILETDHDTRSKVPYLLAHIRYTGPIRLQRTDDLLGEIEGSLAYLVAQIEELIRKQYRDVKRATQQYWDEEIFITFIKSAA
jgi:hypothetical protein